MWAVRVTGKCPQCGVRKHQISSDEQGLQVVCDAIEAHVREAHPEEAKS